jgi:4-hydroxy-tetrahydrodipicolinate synthase
MVDVVLGYPVTAAVKALVGLRRNDPVAWSRMRAPLASLGEAEVRKLGAAIDEIRGKRAA